MPFGVGPMEMIIVLIIALLVLGPKRLPEVGRSVGRGMREFKDSVSGINRDEDDELKAPPAHLAEGSNLASASTATAAAAPASAD